MTTPYCTLADAKMEMNSESTLVDREIMRRIRQVSARIDTLFKKGPALFAPTLAARGVSLSPSVISSVDRTLGLWVDPYGIVPLLSLTGVSIGSSTLVVGTNVQAYPGSIAPYYQLRLIGDPYRSWYNYTCTDGTDSSATVTGVWGYHSDYAHAWLAVDALAAGITDTATTLTVADVDGENAYAEIPRISAGHLLQVGSEWMDVVKTDTATNVVTVIRGVNGSTAAAHSLGAVVSTFQVDENIRRAVSRQVGFQYARRGAYETRRIQEFTAQDFPADILQEFVALIDLFANM